MIRRNNRRQRPKVDRYAMLAGIGYDRGMVGVERCKRGIDLCRRVQTAKIILREGAVTFPAFRGMKQEVDVVLAARDLVEQVDMVDVRAPVDKIMLVPLPNCPHIVYPVVPSLTTNRPPLPPIFWPPPVDPPNRPPLTATGHVPGVPALPAVPFAIEIRTPAVIV